MNSIGGGTGSGLGSLILERLSKEYDKKIKLGINIYPFNDHKSKCVVEPYNTILACYSTFEYHDVTFVFDNQSIYNICRHKANIE